MSDPFFEIFVISRNFKEQQATFRRSTEESNFSQCLSVLRTVQYAIAREKIVSQETPKK